jgi:transcriptional regulator with XRE-family HTH domain
METQFRLNWAVLVEEAKQRRKSLKITQKRLALLAKVSTPTVSRFENEEKDIQLSSALRILTILGLVDKRNLSFVDSNPYHDAHREIVFFNGTDSGKKVLCGITQEALDDHYSPLEMDPIKKFFLHHSEIAQIARRKYITNTFEQDQTILIRTTDF